MSIVRSRYSHGNLVSLRPLPPAVPNRESTEAKGPVACKGKTEKAMETPVRVMAGVLLATAMGGQQAARAQRTKADPVDLSHVPQIHETPGQRDARMQWFRDAKFGMFLHWGPVSLSGKELSWGRNANRPWDIDRHGPRTEDPAYDTLYKQFNPVKFDADQWVRIAQNAGMKYMVIICKHHDGFSMFDSKLTEYDVMATPYGKDIIEQFSKACHKAGMRLGFYYSTRDWYHPDYLAGDNVKYDQWYRGQIEELLSRYGKVDVMWFDHVGGRDWGKWKFDELFSMMYRLQPGLLVNNRSARFCGPPSPEDRGPATPEIRKMTDGDFDTPEERLGHMDLRQDWESCMTLVGGQWSWKPKGRMYTLDETLGMLLNCVSGGGNLLLNIGPTPTGEIEGRQVALLEQVGDWIRPRGEAIYGTRGGPFANGKWGGSSHRGNKVYVFAREWQKDTLSLGPLPQKITAVRKLIDGSAADFRQTEKGVVLTLSADRRDSFFTVLALTLDQSVPDGFVVGGESGGMNHT
jgi:alpha-L-fucosidase